MLQSFLVCSAVMSDHAAKINGGCAKVWEKVSIFMAQNTIPECPTTSVTVLERSDYYAYGERVADSTMQTTSINRWRYNAKEDIIGYSYLHPK